MHSACVVIPVYRLPLTADEETSLSQVRAILGGQKRCFVVPVGLALPAGFLKGEEIVRFSPKFFTYPYGYNRLLMSACFYDSFRAYSHILVYQLDCLVFRDDLDSWCEKDFDFVGSPWLDHYGDPEGGEATWKVGNGGFSLRKVSTAKAVLTKRIPRGRFFPVPPSHLPRPGFVRGLLTNIRKRIRQHLSFWTVEDELENYGENEDRFWALDVIRIQPDFRKPDAEEAFQFGFEVEPRQCLERTRGKLPFGCHGWGKHDREFWERAMESSSAH